MSCEPLKPRDRRAQQRHRASIAFVCVSIGILYLAPWSSPSATEAKNSCVECHGQPSLLVENEKLYDYFRRWSSSIHKKREVTCVDCHGGDPRRDSKERAHQGDLKAATKTSAVNFRNIPQTCGRCHKDVYEGFLRSTHFDRLLDAGKEDEAPNCVTCHGSINVAVLNVNTVEQTCRKCHNQKTGNKPENGEKAAELLRRLLSIRRYYRYLELRSDLFETKPFLDDVDARLRDLSVTWHTFDLNAVAQRSEALLQALRQKRKDMGKTLGEESDEPQTPRE